jgi:hypothetical protein
MDNPETQATLGTQDTFIRPVSCVPNVACVSGLSILYCPLRFSLTFIRPVSYVPNVAWVSGLYIQDE